jgi:hypothetical protein
MKKIFFANSSHYRKPSNFDSISGEITRIWTDDEPPKDQEIVEALKLLETEGIISIFGHNKHVRPNFKLVRDLADD